MDDEMLTRVRPISTLARPKVTGKLPELPEENDEPGAKASEESDPLPMPGSPYMAACSRPSNKPEIVLHVLFKDGSTKGYAWNNFDSIDTIPADGPGKSPLLLVRFAGIVPTELRIAGSNLGRLLALIGRQRLSWIRERPSARGFDGIAAKDEPAEVITGIVVRKLEA